MAGHAGLAAASRILSAIGRSWSLGTSAHGRAAAWPEHAVDCPEFFGGCDLWESWDSWRLIQGRDKSTCHNGVSLLKTACFPRELVYQTQFSRKQAARCIVPLDSPRTRSPISAR